MTKTFFENTEYSVVYHRQTDEVHVWNLQENKCVVIPRDVFEIIIKAVILEFKGEL